MITLLGVLGTQEIIVLFTLCIPVIAILIPIWTYHQGKKRGRLEGRLEEMERARQQNK